ncbi:MAG: efflux RND transporter permease subunit [Acidobacteria bacterium]|nr:efflux RND transporter permease subunit [Acidobacteriota bacterium]
MSHGHGDNEVKKSRRNISRFFVEQRHITWVMLIGVCLWGYYSYKSMPQRKDPDTPVKTAVAITVWPGVSAEKVEQLVTRKIEEKVAQNANVEKIRSISRTNISVVYVDLDENFPGGQIGKEFDDIALKLDSIKDLPDGAGPIQFIKDFGDTSALMLTVASPKVSDAEIDLRAKDVGEAITRYRAQYAGGGNRFTIVSSLTHPVSPRVVQDPLNLFADYLKEKGVATDLHVITEPGFIGVDGASDASDDALLGYTRQFINDKLQAADFHPDSWPPVIIRDPQEARAKLGAVAGDKYSYREMDDFTDVVEKGLKSVPQATKVSRSGILDERIFLLYSQERIASYGLKPGDLPDILGARNITPAGGQLEAVGKNFSIDPSGEFKSEKEIGDVAIARTQQGAPVYLRDVVDVERGYDSPPRYLNFYEWRDAEGNWQRSRAITVAVQMRPNGYIGQFGTDIDGKLAELRKQLPDDLIMARTSDQPRQVTENVELFMNSLYEAIVLVVIVSLIGFWDWRSALLMGLAIPITLFITFGMAHTLGIDLQQVSIATLIIALGLLVDVPVVAGDAIKNQMGTGLPPLVAAWLGPTKLIKAIIFATLTNIVAYLPFLTLPGGTGEFLYSLPIVLTCSLVGSLMVAVTFIPFLGYFLLKPRPEPTIEERRRKGFAAFYYRVGEWAINHRWKVLLGSLVLLAASGLVASRLKTDFFPKDLSYLSYLDVWLPEDAPLSATNEAARQAEEVVRDVVGEYGKEHPEKDGRPREVLKSLTTFVGGGGPRFWFSVSPELQQLNYAQVIIEVNDKHDTNHLVGPLQKALDERVPGARIDVRRLDTGKPITMPVEIRISGDDMGELRREAEKVKDILRAAPYAQRVRDDWGEDTFAVRLETDSDRANAAGITNLDVAASSATGINGGKVTVLREGDKQIPIVARLRMEERAQLADVQNLYVYSTRGAEKVPLRQVSSVEYGMQTEKIRRRNQYRTITVSCMAEPGHLPSEIMNVARTQLDAFAAQLPSGYRMSIGGTEEEQVKGFKNLVVVLIISLVAIYLSLVYQFRNAIKPLVVFAAVPYGLAGGLVALWVMDTPFGFMAFLGIISLVGLIVSHIIVLFDFIEEKHAEGEPLKEAVLDAGIMRLRPVMITVLALVIALVPLAMHGGPLWEPMCYAQMGGMMVATFITLLLVPVIYSIFVLDLKLIKWETAGEAREEEASETGGPEAATPEAVMPEPEVEAKATEAEVKATLSSIEESSGKAADTSEPPLEEVGAGAGDTSRS